MPAIDSLPIKLAVNTFLNDVWYSNALPYWYTPAYFDEPARIRHLSARVDRYLNGVKPPLALKVAVPRWTGGTRDWVMPAVTDQIIFQACVESLAPAIGRQFDRTRVYSCEPNDDPNRVAFMKPQISALMQFHNETVRRLQRGAFVLEFDIERAFPSIDRAAFFTFVDQLKPGGIEHSIVRILLDAWGSDVPGIPLANDGVSFLGNAYLGVVDRIVSDANGDFIRYMDDYRIFGTGQYQLEVVYEKISRGLMQLGLKINPRKVRIGSAKEFLGPAIVPRFPPKPKYVMELDSAIRDDQLAPTQLASLVSRTLKSPDEFLNDGVGRCLLGSLRRYRLHSAINRRGGYQSPMSEELSRALGDDAVALQLAGERLVEYGSNSRDAWRAIWVMYIIEQQGSSKRFGSELDRIERNSALPVEVRLWARRCSLGIGGEPARIDEAWNDLGYVEAGQRCYGERICKGEGF